MTALKEHQVVEIGENVLDENEVALLKVSRPQTKHIEMRSLEKQGFQAKELSVVLGLKHPGSIHVKLYKLHKRLNGKPKAEAAPEIVLILMIEAIIALLFVYFFF